MSGRLGPFVQGPDGWTEDEVTGAGMGPADLGMGGMEGMTSRGRAPACLPRL